MPDIRESITIALAAMAKSPLRRSSIGLLSTLGYQSDRTIDLGGSDPQAFLEFVQSHSSADAFRQDKALCTDWKSADLLFQLTDQELSGQKSLFEETDVTPGLLQSYLFFAIELTGDNYARGKLTDIARQINRVFPMPVMVLIKHKSNKKPVLSIAVINRRQHKRDAAKDVLGKVTIIRDISLTEPHRGHLDILALGLPCSRTSCRIKSPRNGISVIPISVDEADLTSVYKVANPLAGGLSTRCLQFTTECIWKYSNRYLVERGRFYNEVRVSQ